jgi:hypothetical protein
VNLYGITKKVTNKPLKLTPTFKIIKLGLGASWRLNHMGLLDFLIRKEMKEKCWNSKLNNQRQITELEQLCGDDKETYEALLQHHVPRPHEKLE